jgi:TolB protein
MKRFLLAVGSVILVSSAWGSDIVVRKAGTSNKMALSLAGMKSGGGASALFMQTLESDLKRSGWFSVIRTGSGGIQVSGTCADSGSGMSVQCDVRNYGSPETYLRKNYRDASAKARWLAHQMADDIVWSVKHVRGMACSRIAVIGSRGGGKDLYACDYDGANLVQITRDGVPCLAPAWGPNAAFLVYTSFKNGYPDVFRIDMSGTSLRRERIAGYRGLNSGADVSPSGSSVCLTLSKDGNPDLYVIGSRGGSPVRVTRTSQAAEASPSWSPDGSRIVYVSDRARLPQLYIADSSGAGERRVTVEGSENVAPDWGPDGRIAYSSKRGGVYHICVLDPSSGHSEQQTADGADHEDPSWAPDGRHIVYTKTAGYRKALYVLDTFDSTEVPLVTSGGDWSGSAWSGRIGESGSN